MLPECGSQNICDLRPANSTTNNILLFKKPCRESEPVLVAFKNDLVCTYIVSPKISGGMGMGIGGGGVSCFLNLDKEGGHEKIAQEQGALLKGGVLLERGSFQIV